MQIETILLLYNRPDHTSKVLKSLRESGAQQIHAFLDRDPSEDGRRAREEIRRAIASEEAQGLRVRLVERGTKFGLSRNVTTSVSQIFDEGADAVIVLEDDCLLEPGGIGFFKEALEELRDRKKIRSICGYLPPVGGLISSADNDVFLFSRFLTWGWATWRDRWEDYEPDFGKLVRKSEDLNIDLCDFSIEMCTYSKSQQYLEGKADIWSLNWILIHYLTSTFCVYPSSSLITNIGFDGTGTHSVKSSAFLDQRPKNTTQGKLYSFSSLGYYVENEEKLAEFMTKNHNLIYPQGDDS